MATKKEKEQFSAWINPDIAAMPGDFYTKYKKLFPKQGGLSKAVEMVIEEGVKSSEEICEKALENLNKK